MGVPPAFSFSPGLSVFFWKLSSGAFRGSPVFMCMNAHAHMLYVVGCKWPSEPSPTAAHFPLGQVPVPGSGPQPAPRAGHTAAAVVAAAVQDDRVDEHLPAQAAGKRRAGAVEGWRRLWGQAGASCLAPRAVRCPFDGKQWNGRQAPQDLDFNASDLSEHQPPVVFSGQPNGAYFSVNFPSTRHPAIPHAGR